MTRTGFTAFRLGIAGYLIPFLVMYRPELMLIGQPQEILLSLVFAFIVILAAAVALQFAASLGKGEGW